MIRTISLALLLSAALLILFSCSQGAAAQQTKSVELDWPVLSPLRPGALVNITLSGYETYSKVVVFIYKRGNFQERVQYSASGIVGRLTIEMPAFDRGTFISLKADGIKLQYENHPPDDYPIAYSERDYLYAERVLTDNHRARSVRDLPVRKAVYVLGHPAAVRQGQTVTLFWEGFAADTSVCTKLVCPKSINYAPARPAFWEYSYFTLKHLNPQMQLGCYATAVECNPDTYASLGEPVRSVETYMMLLQ